MKNNNDDFINDVLKSVYENAEIKEAINALPPTVSMLKNIYDEMKKQGFDDDKAYDFAKSIMLGR